MNVRKYFIYLTIILAILFSYPSRAFTSAEERKEVTYKLNRDGKVYLENIAGNISVTSWNKDRIRIHAIKKARREMDLDDVSIDIHQYDNGNIRIITRHEKTFSFFNSTGASVDYEILLPEKAQIKIKTISGNVNVKEIGGFLNISTVSGEIDVIIARNGIKCSSVSGDIDLRDTTGNAELKTVSGDMSVANIKGSVVAKTVSGDIEIGELLNAEEVVLDTTSGDVDLTSEINTGGVYEIDTFSGDIRLILPSGSNFKLNVKTSSGNLDTDFSLMMQGNIGRKRLQGVVGRGGAYINISTFSGDIQIKKR